MSQDESIKTTSVLFGEEARSKLLIGIKSTAAAVGKTLGPKGRTCVIENRGKVPTVTKDGVTVARAINPKDPFERMGSDLVKEAASRCNESAGDGTTTATVLVAALCETTHRMLVAQSDQTKLLVGIDSACDIALNAISKLAVPIDDPQQIERVATISANGDSVVGKLVAQATSRVGAAGVVAVEESRSVSTTLEIVAGARFDRGYASPYFVTHGDKCRLEDALVLLTDKKISSLHEIIPILEHVQEKKKSLLIVADDFEGEALQALVLNKSRAGLRVCAVKAPAFGAIREAILGDLQAITGAKQVLGHGGESLASVDASSLGTCDFVVVDSKHTTIFGGKGKPDIIQKRSEEVLVRLDDPTVVDVERKVLRDRLASLTAGIAIIRVGGTTEMEMIERKHRVEDSLNAAQGARVGGVVSGGGTALLFASNSVRKSIKKAKSEDVDSDVVNGMTIVAEALEAPFRGICANAGENADTLKRKYFELEDSDPDAPYGAWCYDASKGEFVMAHEAGIIDPIAVTTSALRNAVSAARAFASTEVVIVDASLQRRHS